MEARIWLLYFLGYIEVYREIQCFIDTCEYFANIFDCKDVNILSYPNKWEYNFQIISYNDNIGDIYHVYQEVSSLV